MQVKSLEPVEEKSLQEKEAELLKESENEKETEKEELQEKEIAEEDVLSFLKKKFNKEVEKLDDLFVEPEIKEDDPIDLPEDVSQFLKYKKETGRGMDDYLKLQRDFSNMPEEDLLKEYFLTTEEGLEEEDVDVLLSDYSYDEDVDDESHIKRVKLNRKKKILEAQKFFETQKEKYKQPTESVASGLSDSDKKEFDSYKQYIAEAKNIQEETTRKQEWFKKKTDELFSREFKGFEFDVDGNKVVFNPGDVEEVKSSHLNPGSFISKYLDDNGMLKDASGYHKALAMAMNPDKFAKFFYEQGLSKGVDGVQRKIKNIDMDANKAPEGRMTTGIKARAVNPDSGSGLKVKTRSN